MTFFVRQLLRLGSAHLTMVVALILGLSSASTMGMERAAPSELGLSETQLARITTYLEREVESGRIAGAVAGIARHGRVGYLTSVGKRNADSSMQSDTLFRIASMTKAITSVAVLTLVEDGKIALNDPLAKFLPEFHSVQALASDDGPSTETVPLDRPITIHDLLTHRSGLTYGWFGPEKLDALYRQQSVSDILLPSTETLPAHVKRLSNVPLRFQPGTRWDYSMATDVLGRVIEVSSGVTLDRFLYERVFRPLGMNDTYFAVPKEKQKRLATLYTVDENKRLVQLGSKPVAVGTIKISDGANTEANRFFAGGSGLVSTTPDYLRFLQMMLNGGELDGARILSRSSVQAMTRNQIGEMTIPFPGHGDGFGLGVGVMTDRGAGDDPSSIGSFSWGGIYNTYYWVDPQEQLVGVIMTQVFPYDHLTIRESFKKLTYGAIDDSGMARVYWYEPGEKTANPHFNPRQLRVNAPEVSTHPEFAVRSEPRSSGMARIPIDEDLRQIRRADMYAEIWGGHPGTSGKRVSVNGRTTHTLADLLTQDHHCTHSYPQFNLRPIDLVRGFNSIQFACDQGDTFWGHYIADNVALRIGLVRQDKRLIEAGLSEFDAKLVATPLASPAEGFEIQLDAPPELLSKVATVRYQAKYFGFDENGNDLATDWHGMTKGRAPYGMLGASTTPPFRVEWNTSMLPVQNRVAIRAMVQFKNQPAYLYQTKDIKGLKIERKNSQAVTIHYANQLPKPFWSRAGQRKVCSIQLDFDPKSIDAAELHVVAWTGGPGDVKDYFTLNGHQLNVADGASHETVYSRLEIDPSWLRKGANEIVLLSDTHHHGIEILYPGPAIVTRTAAESAPRQEGISDSVATTKVELTVNAIDESAGGLECYRIDTPNATFYLDKVGAGLSSMIDKEGNDWIAFHPRKGSGAAGEYRGFPNAVFQEAGSYFHPQNAGTDPCVTVVEEESAERVVIHATSSNGKWAGRYVFTSDGCSFALTKKPENHNYWILYEGVPGGQYDDSDWWMTSASATKQLLDARHQVDIPNTEWIAFGDRKLNRALVLTHSEADEAPDQFYQMQRKMTVFGFGRAGMTKHLDSVPRQFSIGFVESTDHAVAAEYAEKMIKLSARGTNAGHTTNAAHRALERFALTSPGHPSLGKHLFWNDKRTRCSTCHRVGSEGGTIGPDLSKIGGKFDRPHLIESLLEPSRQIVEGYRTSVIETESGKRVTGIVRDESESQLTLVSDSGVEQVIAASEIESRTEMTASLMPTGLADQLSPNEFADLVSYLETLQTGKARFGSGVSGPISLPDGFSVSTIATGLSGATAMELSPDGRIFVCEQNGRLRVIKDGQLLDQPFATLPVEHNWERGLIGVTLAPDFPNDPHVYVVYVTDKPFTHHRVSRFNADGDVAVTGSERILLRGDDQSKFGGNVPAGHQGGAIHFGPDGMLYIGLGEQTAKTPSQRFDALQGKILRINPDGSIPPDNPFRTQTNGKYQAIWCMGCRNPFTFAFSSIDGSMLINDVGGKFEEINRGLAGANFGWPTVDHGPTSDPRFTGPIHIYPEASIAGGVFIPRHPSWPEAYHGRYLFADFVHGWIKSIDPSNAATAQPFAAGIRRAVDLRISADGRLYVLLRNAWVVDDKFEGGTGALLEIRPQRPK